MAFDDRIKVLKSCWYEGWDGRGAMPVSSTAINNCVEIKDLIGDTDIWLIAPGVNGDVMITNKFANSGILLCPDNTFTWWAERETLEGEECVEFSLENVKEIIGKI